MRAGWRTLLEGFTPTTLRPSAAPGILNAGNIPAHTPVSQALGLDTPTPRIPEGSSRPGPELTDGTLRQPENPSAHPDGPGAPRDGGASEAEGGTRGDESASGEHVSPAERDAALSTVPEELHDRAASLYDRAHNTHLPPHLRNFAAGELFNLQNHSRYPANEVYIDILDGSGNRTGQRVRVDSYLPGQEIVSRKNTQFGELASPTSGIRYLQELLDKYPANDAKFIVSDVPSARSNPALRDRIGEPLSASSVILEVPVQGAPIPQQVLDFAADNRITIRDVTGRIYD